jgi:hypothetical protein
MDAVAVVMTPEDQSRAVRVAELPDSYVDQLLERGVRKSVVALDNDVSEWIATWNADPRPFAWTKTAEEILATPSTNTSHAFPARGTSGFTDSQST